MKFFLSLLIAFCFVAALASATSRRRAERAYRRGLNDGLGYGRYNNEVQQYNDGRGRQYRESGDYYFPVQSVPSSAGSYAAPGSSSANVVLGNNRGTSLGARAESEQGYGSSRTNSEAYGTNY